MSNAKMQYEVGKQTNNNDDIKLRSDIASINYTGDFLSDPADYWTVKHRVESALRSLHDSRHRNNLYTYSAIFSDETKTITVCKEHWRKPGNIVLCTVKPIPDE